MMLVIHTGRCQQSYFATTRPKGCRKTAYRCVAMAGHDQLRVTCRLVVEDAETEITPCVLTEHEAAGIGIVYER